MTFIFLLYLHRTLFFFLQAVCRRHTRVCVGNACGIHNTSTRYGSQFDCGVWCRPRHRTVRSFVGIWLIIVGCTGRVIVLTTWIWRWVGHIIGWKFASLTRLFRIGICKWQSLVIREVLFCGVEVNWGAWKIFINLLHDCVSSSPLKSSLLESSSSVFDNVCLLCFIRLFWNQTLTCSNVISGDIFTIFRKFILTCRSVRSRLAAISIRRGRHKYLLKWNSFSNSRSWVFV